MSDMQMALPTGKLTPFIQGPIQQTITHLPLYASSSVDTPQFAYMPEHSNPILPSTLLQYIKENKNGSPPLNSSLGSCKHFCFSLAMDFQDKRLIFILWALLQFINPCRTSGITELLWLVKVTGCTCCLGKGAPGERGGERGSDIRGLGYSQLPCHLLRRAEPQSNHNAAPQLCPTLWLKQGEGFCSLSSS